MRQCVCDSASLVHRYCALVYAQTGSHLETARRLRLDRRTVKARIDALTGSPGDGADGNGGDS